MDFSEGGAGRGQNIQEIPFALSATASAEARRRGSIDALRSLTRHGARRVPEARTTPTEARPPMGTARVPSRHATRGTSRHGALARTHARDLSGCARIPSAGRPRRVESVGGKKACVFPLRFFIQSIEGSCWSYDNNKTTNKVKRSFGWEEKKRVSGSAASLSACALELTSVCIELTRRARRAARECAARGTRRARALRGARRGACEGAKGAWVRCAEGGGGRRRRRRGRRRPFARAPGGPPAAPARRPRARALGAAAPASRAGRPFPRAQPHRRRADATRRDRKAARSRLRARCACPLGALRPSRVRSPRPARAPPRAAGRALRAGKHAGHRNRWPAQRRTGLKKSARARWRCAGARGRGAFAVRASAGLARPPLARALLPCRPRRGREVWVAREGRARSAPRRTRAAAARARARACGAARARARRGAARRGAARDGVTPADRTRGSATPEPVARRTPRASAPRALRPLSAPPPSPAGARARRADRRGGRPRAFPAAPPPPA